MPNFAEPIYTGETFWFRIPNVKLNGVAVTDLAPPDSFVYTVLDSFKIALVPPVTGSLVYNAATLTWEKELTAPTIAGTYHLNATAIQGLSNGFWPDYLLVQARS